IITRTVQQTKTNATYFTKLGKTIKSVVANPDQADEISLAGLIDLFTSRAGHSIEWQYKIKMVTGAARIILSDLESEELRRQLDAAKCRGGVYHIDADLNVKWIPSSKEGVVGRVLRPMKNVSAISLAMNLMSVQERMD